MSVLTFRNFTQLDDRERELVLGWRNSVRIRSVMTNDHLIARADHWRFIDGLANRLDCRYFLFSVDGVPAGVLDFVRIDPVTRSCEPGLYIGDERFLGIAFLIYYCALEYAFETLDCQCVNCTVLKANAVSSLICLRVFGARQVGATERVQLLAFDRAAWVSRRESLLLRLKRQYQLKEIVWQ